jgi:hypothetical protein
MIRGKVAEYMERAEKLKQHLNQNDDSNRKKPSAMGANGKSAGGSGKGGGYAVSRAFFRFNTDTFSATKMRVTPTPRSSVVRSLAPFCPRSPTFDGKMSQV